MERAEKTPKPVADSALRQASAEQSAALAGFHDSPRMVAQRQQLRSLFGEAVQLHDGSEAAAIEPNRTGLPDGLKAGVESLSGMSMDHVKVHYNSSQPAQLNALAYAQGSDIHVAPGQEQHLPHEAWHVVQQAQGRVKPTLQMKDGVAVNDEDELEHEADVMGARAASGAVQMAAGKGGAAAIPWAAPAFSQGPVQRKVGFEFQMLNTSVGLMDEVEAPTMVEGPKPKASKDSFSQYPEADLALTNNPRFIVDGMSWEKGANAEYATRMQYDDPAAAKSDVAEMAAHATTNIVKHKTSDIDGKKLFVWRCDTSDGQPQMNIDVAFENVGKEESIRRDDSKKFVTSRDDYVGVTKKNMWILEETERFLDLRARAKGALDTMNLQGAAAFVTLPAVDIEPEVPREIQGLSTLISAVKLAVMTYVSGRIPAGSSGLSKDLAILPKVQLPTLFDGVKTKLQKLNGETLILDIDGLLGYVLACGDQILTPLVPVAERDNNVLMTTGGPPLPEQIKGTGTVNPDMDKETAVMEYRRAKIIPVAKWADFAEGAVNVFNQLDTPQ